MLNGVGNVSDVPQGVGGFDAKRAGGGPDLGRAVVCIDVLQAHIDDNAVRGRSNVKSRPEQMGSVSLRNR